MKIKYNYCCLNPGCTNRTIQIIEKPEAQEKDEEYCFDCEGPIKLLGYTPTGGFLRTSIMTPEQRKAVLKKRSSEHFNKEIKERKNQMLKDAFNTK